MGSSDRKQSMNVIRELRSPSQTFIAVFKGSSYSYAGAMELLKGIL